MTPADAEALRARLRRAWSARSSARWRAENPALGQCSATALVVQAALGGEILKTLVDFEGGHAWHFYNRIAGRAHDFTASQFALPIGYSDTPATRGEALADTSEQQVAALSAAFRATASCPA